MSYFKHFKFFKFLWKCLHTLRPIKANLGHMLLIVNLVEKWPNFYDYQFWKRVEYNDPAHASSICNKVTTTFRPTTINLSAFKGVKVITREPCSWNEVKSFIKEQFYSNKSLKINWKVPKNVASKNCGKHFFNYELNSIHEICMKWIIATKVENLKHIIFSWKCRCINDKYMEPVYYTVSPIKVPDQLLVYGIENIRRF